jgi:hypothetical protein
MINRTYNSTIILLLAVLLWGFILYSSVPFYYNMYAKSSSEIQSNNNPNLENCKGLGDANCYNKLLDHVNNISGLEVSSSVFIGDGKFNTTILKNNPSGSGIAAITTTITVDCNCQIVNTGGTTIQ